MIVLFCKDNSLLSWLIRLLTWSSWSHVAVQHGEMAIQAVWPKVELVSAEEIIDRYTVVEMRIFPAVNRQGAWSFLQDQVGKPYDWMALLGFLFRKDWARPTKWFCSELVAAAAVAANSPLYRPEVTWRITPGMLYFLPSKKV